MVLAERVEGLAIGRIRETGDGTFMGERGVNELAAAGVGLPDADRLVHAGGGEVPAVGRPGDGVEPVGGVAEGVKALAGGRVPDLHGPVGGDRGEQRAVRAEGDAVDGVAVVLEGGALAAVGEVPELDEAVVAAGG